MRPTLYRSVITAAEHSRHQDHVMPREEHPKTDAFHLHYSASYSNFKVLVLEKIQVIFAEYKSSIMNKSLNIKNSSHRVHIVSVPSPLFLIPTNVSPAHRKYSVKFFLL